VPGRLSPISERLKQNAQTEARTSIFVEESRLSERRSKSAASGSAQDVITRTKSSAGPQIWPGANWHHPLGPNGNLKGKEKYPVVYIASADAEAYAH